MNNELIERFNKLYSYIKDNKALSDEALEHIASVFWDELKKEYA